MVELSLFERRFAVCCYQNNVLISFRKGFATLVSYLRIHLEHLLVLVCADG